MTGRLLIDEDGPRSPLVAVSMRNLETFVLRVDERADLPPHGLAVVRRAKSGVPA